MNMKRAYIIAGVVICILVGVQVASAEEIAVGPTLEKSSFKPALPAPFPAKDFLTSLVGLVPDNLGIVETKFWESPELHKLCSKPRVIGFPEKDLRGARLSEFNCFVFFDGDVQRLKSRRSDMERLKHRDMEFDVPRDATLILLGGSFVDNIPRAIANAGGAQSCDRCVTREGSKDTTCTLTDLPINPVCSVTQYMDIKAMVISGMTYQRSLTGCSWYVEGPWSGTADVCFVKASGGGRINADCSRRFGVDATDGDFTIFLGSGDGFVEADTGDTIYVGDGVDLLFIHDKGGTAKVVKPRDAMPCLRIISAED